MNIEIKGIGFPNKGAELMLSAIRAWHEQADPEGRLVLSSQSSYRNRGRFGTWQNFSRERLPTGCGAMANLIPRRLLNEFGIVRDQDIEAVLDASGYAYSDQWGARKVYDRLVKRIGGWKARGTNLILLPQAFGPFTDPALRGYMKQVLDYATLVFARDRISFEHLKALAPDAGNIFLAPDFTCLVEGRLPERYKQWKGRACVIPNQKMVEHVTHEEHRYLTFLKEACSTLHERGLQPFLLLHEGPKDKRLCEEVRRESSFEIPIVEAADPEVIKGIIRHAHVVITSRFHGFVSALSKGVPAIATSWSHKYEMLAEDYDNPQLVLKDFSREHLGKALAFLDDPAAYKNLHTSLLSAAEENRRLSVDMWSQVEESLGLHENAVS
jgi:colanic acid/amylovoran biosynthesis protein